ncbi:MAG: helix-turn-helix domain-containing protein [Pyrinomonadaceae bacterium]
MARRKFRNSKRKPAGTEAGYNEFISNRQAPLTTRTELIKLVRGGEDTFLELKLKLSNTEKIAQEIVALANTAGGIVVFGVNDQLRVEGVRNPEGVQEELVKICRNKISPPLLPLIDQVYFDSGIILVVLEILPKAAPYRTIDGKFFLRFGNEKREARHNEFVELIKQTRPLTYENIPLSGLYGKDFDDALLWGFASSYEMVKVNKTPSYDTEKFLKRDLLLAIGAGDAFMPMVAGVLLFGETKTVEEKVPNAAVLVRKFSGKNEETEIIEEKWFTGNLLTQFERIFHFVSRYTKLWKHRTKELTKSKSSQANFHLYSVREALANLLIHRDFAIFDAKARINIFADSIEFINSRRTQGFVSPGSKAIKFGITQRLNPQLTSIFQRNEYGINLPQGGLPMILKQSELFSGKRVEIYTVNDTFKLKIYGA